MRALPSTLLAPIILMAVMLALSCSSDPSVPDDDEPSLLPTPAIEYTRPLANTDLTYGQVIVVSRNDPDVKVAAAESTLTALVAAGVPLRDAWVTGRWDRYIDPTGSVSVTVRLTRADTTISDHGFVRGVVVGNPYNLDEDTWHYSFGPPSPVVLPEKVLEFRRSDWSGGLMYYRPWFPDAYSTYYGDFVLDQKWLSGPEAYLTSLIEAGVVVNNAWVSATNYDGQFGGRGIVLEVAEPHPVLGASGFSEGGPRLGWDDLGSVYVWNYCFTSCPEDVELPRPEKMWTVLVPEQRRIYWRSVRSQDYDALFASQERVEQHLQAMLRARAPIERAWIPVMAAAGEYTYLAVECRDARVWWWGYEDEPAGGVADVNRWTYVRCYDLRDPPPNEDDLQPQKPHEFEQTFAGDP